MSQKRAKIMIHMGDAKTGTTSLQGILNARSDALQACGMVYARSGRQVAHAIGHHALPKSMWACAEKTDLNSLPPWADLRAEIDALAPGETLIISSEGFSSMNADWQAQMMADFFDGDDVRFLLSVRNPVDWIESMYSQNVKATPFTLATFQKFQRRVTLKGICAALHLATCFSPQAFIVLPYDDDIVARMLAALGLADLSPATASGDRANVRDPEALLEAFLALNAVEMPNHARGRLYATMTQACREHGTGARGPRDGPIPQFTFTDAQKQAFMERQGDLIARFCATFDIPRAQIVKG